MAGQFSVKGFCEDAYLLLKEAFEENFAEGLELGASLAVTHHGRLVVDLWGGCADRKGLEPWQEDTIVCVFSTTKIPTIICTLMAIDRGLLDLDTSVAHYWPEFGRHGKDKITVREALTHRALVPGFRTPQPWDALHQWDRMSELIADEAPWFDRGTICYHPYNFGHILGELVRRVSGIPFRDFFVHEVARPLDADFQIGLTDKADVARLALLRHEQLLELEEGSIPFRVMNSILNPPRGDPWRLWEQQSAVIPSSGGFGNARSLARIGSIMASGGTVDSRLYLSADVVDEARAEQFHGQCPLWGDLRIGLGFGLDGRGFPAPSASAYHWGGYGGSWCVMDNDTGISAAYAMNHCHTVDEEGEFGTVWDDRRQGRLWSALGDVMIAVAKNA